MRVNELQYLSTAHYSAVLEHLQKVTIEQERASLSINSSGGQSMKERTEVATSGNMLPHACILPHILQATRTHLCSSVEHVVEKKNLNGSPTVYISSRPNGNRVQFDPLFSLALTSAYTSIQTDTHSPIMNNCFQNSSSQKDTMRKNPGKLSRDYWTDCGRLQEAGVNIHMYKNTCTTTPPCNTI